MFLIINTKIAREGANALCEKQYILCEKWQMSTKQGITINIS